MVANLEPNQDAWWQAIITRWRNGEQLVWAQMEMATTSVDRGTSPERLDPPDEEARLERAAIRRSAMSELCHQPDPSTRPSCARQPRKPGQAFEDQPDQRSLSICAAGYLCHVTEHWNQWARVDRIFSASSNLAIRDAEILAVQACIRSDVATRATKIANQRECWRSPEGRHSNQSTAGERWRARVEHVELRGR